ncbi:MAG: DUF4157 domain-containing protein [Bacteroidota bacterium]
MPVFFKNNIQKGGNQTVQQKKENDSFFGVQAKLSIGKSDDKYEKEADAVADKVVERSNGNDSFFGNNYAFNGKSRPTVQRVATEDVSKEEETETIQEKPLADSITPVVQLRPEEDEAIQEKCKACEEESHEVQKQEASDAIAEEEQPVQKQAVAEEEQPIQKQEMEEETSSSQATEIQQKCEACEEEQTVQKVPFEEVQKKEAPQKANTGSGVEESLKSSKGSGTPLDKGLKNEMESGFGTDFSQVRVHTDSRAIMMNRDLGAQAFTNGNDIYFNQGKFDGSSKKGKHLLAHELTHVVQQTGQVQRKADPDNPPKTEAPDPTITTAETAPADEPSTATAPEVPPSAERPEGINESIPLELNAQMPQTEADPGLLNDPEPEEASGSMSESTDFSLQPPPPPEDSANSLPAHFTEPDTGFEVPPNEMPMASQELAPNLQMSEEDDGGIFGGIKSRLNSVVNGLKSGWTSLSTMATGAFNGVLNTVSGLTSGLQNMATSALSGLQGAWNSVSQMATNMANGIKGVVSSAMGAVMAPVRSISASLENLDADSIRSAWGTVKEVIGGIWQRVQLAGQVVMQRMSALWQGLSSRFRALFQNLSAGAKAVFDRVRNTVQGIQQKISAAWNKLFQSSGEMSSIVSGVASRLASLLGGLVSWGQRIWDSIQSGWNALRNKVSTFLSGIMQRITAVWERIKAFAQKFWQSIVSLWQRLKGWVMGVIRRFVGGLEGLWKKFSSFSIDKLVNKIAKYAPFIKSVQQAVADPDSAMVPLVDALAKPLEEKMPGKAISIGGEKARENAPGESAGPQTATTVQKKADPSVIQRSAMGTASMYDVYDGFTRHIMAKWASLSIWQMIKDLIWTIIWPWPTVGREIVDFLMVDMAGVLNNLFLTRNPISEPLGFLHDLYTNLLHLLDIPLALWRRITNIGMALLGWITLALTLLGAAGGSVASGVIGGIASAAVSLGLAAPAGGGAAAAGGGLAGAGAGFAAGMAVGEILVGSFMLAHIATIVKVLVDLFTGNQTNDQKEDDYSQLADSLIGMGVTVVLLFVGWVASKLANVILNLIRSIRPPKPPVKGPGGGGRGGGGELVFLDPPAARPVAPRPGPRGPRFREPTMGRGGQMRKPVPWEYPEIITPPKPGKVIPFPKPAPPVGRAPGTQSGPGIGPIIIPTPVRNPKKKKKKKKKDCKTQNIPYKWVPNNHTKPGGPKVLRYCVKTNRYIKHGHHTWPKFIGGPAIQTLLPVDQNIHLREFHGNQGPIGGIHTYIENYLNNSRYYRTLLQGNRIDRSNTLATGNQLLINRMRTGGANDAVLRRRIRNQLELYYRHYRANSLPKMPASAYNTGLNGAVNNIH